MSLEKQYFELTELFNSLPRYTLPIQKDKFPANGVYILFEEGEKEGELDRIVRVGTHRGNGRFAVRLGQHFTTNIKLLRQNSIFRKHVGRCYLNMNNDDYLPIWDLKTKSREDKAANLHLKNLTKEKEIETFISEYMKGLSITFIYGVDNVEERLELESGLIASIAQYSGKAISKNWLGKKHPDWKISKSGLWNIHHLTSNPLTEKQLIRIKELLGK